VLVVSPKLPVANLKEFIAYAKANPGKLNFASSGIGTIVHLNGEFFKMLTGVDIVHVPYKGTALAIPDLASGNVAMLFDSLASAMPNIKSGSAKPLALNAPRRSHLLPDVPTLAEAGLPAFDRYTWFGMFAPAGTPPDIVRKLQAETVAALKSPDLRERFDAVGAEPVGSTSEQFVERIKSDTLRWAEVIKAANVKVQ
jgi:tripartite-type tricarboxylate transporter receptor subunit TctC